MKLAVGLMSGTSLDGVDTILIEIEGSGETTKFKVIDFECYDLEASLKAKIIENMAIETSNIKAICSLNFELGHVFAAAVQNICKKNHIDTSELDYIASHGQTLYHLPKAELPYFASTLQLGEPSIIAYRCKTKVVSGFRGMDMAAGGEGAPLVPYVDALLFRNAEKTVALHNVGGIANTTILKKAGSLEDLLAFDTGPGNMIIDALCVHFYGEAYDREGAHAGDGRVNQSLLEAWLAMPFFKIKGPKSTGRELFGADFVARIIEESKILKIEPDDLIATATAFTAYSMAMAYSDLPYNVDEVIVCGGGAYNKTLLKYLSVALPDTSVTTLEAHGSSSFAKEALAFAILGNERLHGHPANVKSATGADAYVVLGSVTEGGLNVSTTL
ncbi:anhydro-N-acetylmuramic acid kinase AnmK [Fusibacter sp. 3D3]|uniref:anhydro-N-acetylmuramic acid kinase AnmK n=1 Tax=Fusibacter sp. 3D3 TaxID=1048380 RepID=UPI0008529046|nr:anhydro-N-acetylmuramic acid kinase AnmK [Fusibacter sp. 3D3]GAU75936.1 anhydro-N-acetylmuramic acid kinase [Fusibacter sp. 3D3]